jgi:hypothetical protein
MARLKRSSSAAARGATSIFGWLGAGACDTPATAMPEALLEAP